MDAGAIVVGAGHNGLICAAYLARAGVSVLVLEARDDVGGCASTVEALGGALVNICNCDHTLVRMTPIADELDLARHGLQYLELDPPYLNINWHGGPGWFLFHDLERTLESLAMTYPADVDGYRRYAKAAMPVAALILDLANTTPTPGKVLTSVAHRHRTAAAARLLQWSRRSVGDVLRGFFTTEQVRGPIMATGPAVWGLPPETPGTGHGALGFALRHVAPVGRPVGGSGALPASVERSLRAAGGRVRCGAKVERILLERDAVRGVRLANGDELLAPIVIAAGDPRAAMVEWLTDPPAAAHRAVARHRGAPGHDGYEAKIDAVITARPRYRAVDDRALRALGLDLEAVLRPTCVVSPSLDDMSRAHAQHRLGAVAARPMFLANYPSVLDPSVAAALPAGSEVMSLEVLWTPYELEGGWAGSAEPQRWIDTYSGLLEDGFADSIVDYRVMGPRDYEEQFQMARGYAPSFAGTPVSAMLGKSPELTRYETPVKGLFLTGAGTFPGSGVWGASGRNAAAAVLASDRRSRRVVARVRGRRRS